jgi:hypothetical protein
VPFRRCSSAINIIAVQYAGSCQRSVGGHENFVELLIANGLQDAAEFRSGLDTQCLEILTVNQWRRIQQVNPGFLLHTKQLLTPLNGF